MYYVCKYFKKKFQDALIYTKKLKKNVPGAGVLGS
ncbi:hypothetical protein Mgra_00005749, partial [Meloidogyne graminicola]